MANNQPKFDFASPVGRMIQGSPIKQPLTDMDTGQPELDAEGKPVMGVFFALAFPKQVRGADNAEFSAFWNTMSQAATAFWPGLFANSTPARFSWKYQDGDGVDFRGESVANKPGFAGNHIIKFKTSYDMNCFIEGNFAPHQQLQKPEDVIKRGYWVRCIGTIASNGATGNKVPGIILYPNLLSLVGGSPADEIRSGPDAQTAFSAAALGYVPEGVARPGEVPSVAAGGAPNVAVPSVAVPSVPTVSVPSTPAVSVPSTPAVSVPSVPTVTVPAPAAPQWTISPALAATGLTLEALLDPKNGWTHETALAAGHIIRAG